MPQSLRFGLRPGRHGALAGWGQMSALTIRGSIFCEGREFRWRARRRVAYAKRSAHCFIDLRPGELHRLVGAFPALWLSVHTCPRIADDTCPPNPACALTKARVPLTIFRARH